MSLQLEAEGLWETQRTREIVVVVVVGGEGSTVVSAAVAFRSVSVFLSWVAPDCPPPRHPRTATSLSPVVSFPLVLSPTFHPLLLG